MRHVRQLRDLAPSDLEAVGPKAAMLAGLVQAGFAVPEGFCLAVSAFRRFVSGSELGLLLVEARAGAGGAAAAPSAARLREALSRARMPADVAAELRVAARALGGSLAVRSSALGEDAPGASYAGQYDTFLHVAGEDAVVACVLACWRSLCGERALAYRAAHPDQPGSPGMAVIVQRMIRADAAGALLTRDPVTGRGDALIVNASRGPPDAVLGGAITPDEYRVDRATRTVSVARASARRALSHAELRALAALGERVEAWCGAPQCIEWASSGGRLFLLQSRALGGGVTWKSPLPGTRWTRTWRLGEWLSAPVSPLFETLAIPILVAAREEGGGGRLGWRLPRCWSSPPPWSCVVNGYFYARAELHVPSLAWFLVATVPRIERAMRRWRARDLPRYLERLSALQRFDPRGARAVELMPFVEGLCRDAGEWWHLVALDGGGAAFTERLFRRLCARWLPGGPAPELMLSRSEGSLLDGERELEAMAQTVRAAPGLREALDERDAAAVAARLATTDAGRRLRASLRAFLARFGHQVYCLDWIAPTLAEDPSGLFSLLRRRVEEAAEPRARLAAQASRAEVATAEALRLLERAPLRRRVLRAILRRARALAARREETVLHFQRGWPLMRRAIRELGDRLAAAGRLCRPDDVFFVTAAEARAAAEALDGAGPADLRLALLAAQRRALWRWQGRLAPPETLADELRLAPAPLPARTPGDRRPAGGGITRIVGVGVSPGLARGPACVMSSVAEFPRLRSGDVLVTVATTGAWTPLFALASAVVTEVGGVTSHASMVAREFGLPTVVATGSATQVIKDGQLLSVDGTAGTVSVEPAW